MLREIRTQKKLRMKFVAFLFACVCQIADWLGCHVETTFDEKAT